MSSLRFIAPPQLSLRGQGVGVRSDLGGDLHRDLRGVVHDGNTAERLAIKHSKQHPHFADLTVCSPDDEHWMHPGEGSA